MAGAPDGPTAITAGTDGAADRAPDGGLDELPDGIADGRADGAADGLTDAAPEAGCEDFPGEFDAAAGDAPAGGGDDDVARARVRDRPFSAPGPRPATAIVAAAAMISPINEATTRSARRPGQVKLTLAVRRASAPS
ncbi:MAG TPA: hypothetical protein VNF73_11270 [Candidatus Saccharimonadales bacterium]|nr:hypothetical protein [Candidatus Saccharimonadales bacterium]